MHVDTNSSEAHTVSNSKMKDGSVHNEIEVAGNRSASFMLLQLRNSRFMWSCNELPI
jgi:hypothetical protein